MVRSGYSYFDVPGTQVDGHAPRDIYCPFFCSHISASELYPHPLGVVLLDHLTEELVIRLPTNLLGFHEFPGLLCHGNATCCVHVWLRAAFCSRR